MKMIRFWAAECRMPLCYGGGIKSVDQAKAITGLGVEKVALSSSAVAHPPLIAAIAEKIGNQSVVVILDVKKGREGSYEVWTHNGTKNTGQSPVLFTKKLQSLGVGEIVINSIDRDGEMRGYDLKLTSMVREVSSVPLTVLGGAGSLRDIGNLIEHFGTIGAAAGSLFVFKGSYRAVLINYPSPEDRDKLIGSVSSRLSPPASMST
jgi:cyclase